LQKRKFFLDRRFYSTFKKGLDEGACTDDWYLSLFGSKRNYLSGDITPGYSNLNDKAVEHAAGLLPNVPVILLLRHPVDRFKSAISMRIRTGRIAEDDIESAEQVERLLSKKGFTARGSFPSLVWDRWVRYFGPERCRYFFIEEISSQPENVRKQVAEFIGLKSPEFMLRADFNRKAKNKRYEFSVEAEQVLYEHFHDEILRCRKTFGRYALDWKTQAG
jgi:hypothetical protein